jgi:hypothetical protein
MFYSTYGANYGYERENVMKAHSKQQEFRIVTIIIFIYLSFHIVHVSCTWSIFLVTISRSSAERDEGRRKKFLHIRIVALYCTYGILLADNISLSPAAEQQMGFHPNMRKHLLTYVVLSPEVKLSNVLF